MTIGRDFAGRRLSVCTFSLATVVRLFSDCMDYWSSANALPKSTCLEDCRWSLTQVCAFTLMFLMRANTCPSPPDVKPLQNGRPWGFRFLHECIPSLYNRAWCACPECCSSMREVNAHREALPCTPGHLHVLLCRPNLPEGHAQCCPHWGMTWC